jgi:hypothetical protein
VRPSAQQLAAYEKAILPTVRDWGSIEVLGMRPAVADLRSGSGVPASAVEVEARAWVSSLRLDRDKLRAVSPPPGLDEAARFFDEAMERYLEAATLFGRAAAAPAGESRRKLIDDGTAAAAAGASTYNRASVVLQQAHRRLGQSPSPDFPDHL